MSDDGIDPSARPRPEPRGFSTRPIRTASRVPMLDQTPIPIYGARSVPALGAV